MAQPGPEAPPANVEEVSGRLAEFSPGTEPGMTPGPASLPATEPQLQSAKPREDDRHHLAGSSSLSKPQAGRRVSRSVVPGLPRAQTFARQLSEQRNRLDPVEPTIDERRAASADRRLHVIGSRAKSQVDPNLHGSLADISASLAQDAPSSSTAPRSASTTKEPEVLAPGGPPAPALGQPEGLDGADASDEQPRGQYADETFSDTDSLADREFEALIRHELQTTWILNLSMRYRDRSSREKFFVTYRDNGLWRRVTITVDYRNAPEDSLEMDLLYTSFQRDKNAKIYEAIRDSLSEIRFFDTVTNLKVGTEDGRLHVHVVEDGNEIIGYPQVSQVAHINCRHIKESEITFDRHMSGFVYKVAVGGQALVKKEIPGPDTVEEFLYEVNALSSLGYSDNVIKFYGLVVDDDGTSVKGLLLSYADGGSLLDVIYDNCKWRQLGLQWSIKQRWARQIVQGLADIHEAGFVQGDFTLSNIVIDDKDDAKIIDINRRGCPVGWEPPEATPILETQNSISIYIGVKSDLFQLGMVLWALAMEEGEPDREGRPLTFGPEQQIPHWYRQVTEICLNPDPRRRWQASMLLSLFPSELAPSLPADIDVGEPAHGDTAGDAQLDKHQPVRTAKISSYNWWMPGSAYTPAGPPVQPSWHHAPRGRSPPSPLPSHLNGDFHSPQGRHSRPDLGASMAIQSSYSDAGEDEVRHGGVGQKLTPRASEEMGPLVGQRDDGDSQSFPNNHASPSQPEHVASQSDNGGDTNPPAAPPSRGGEDVRPEHEESMRLAEEAAAAPGNPAPDPIPEPGDTGDADRETRAKDTGLADMAVPLGNRDVDNQAQTPSITISTHEQDMCPSRETSWAVAGEDGPSDDLSICDKSQGGPSGAGSSGAAEGMAQQNTDSLAHPSLSSDSMYGGSAWDESHGIEGCWEYGNTLAHDATTPRVSPNDGQSPMDFTDPLAGVGSGHGRECEFMDRRILDDDFHVIGRTEVPSI